MACSTAPSFAWRRRLGLRVSGVGVLAALVLLLVASPFVRGLKEAPLHEAVLFSLVMCTGLIASKARRKTNQLAFGLVSIALVARWLNHLWPGECPAVTFILPAIALL